MSFISQLSRERARCGDVREGRNAALKVLISRDGPTGAVINWVAVSQLVNMVQQKGSIPDVVRKTVKELLASNDLHTCLHTLTVIDLLALNCPDGKVRAQLAGPKWVQKLGRKASSDSSCTP